MAAAPRLITMTLLAVSALLSRPAAAELVELTLLANAREKGAGIQLTFFNSLRSFCTSVCPGAASWILIAYSCSVARYSLLGWQPAGLPAPERLRLWITQLARQSWGDRRSIFFSVFMCWMQIWKLQRHSLSAAASLILYGWMNSGRSMVQHRRRLLQPQPDRPWFV